MILARVLVLVLLGALLLAPPDVNSCGPFIPEAQFTALHGPIKPSDDYARGELGILRPHFYRKYLFVAYRSLAGIPLTKSELGAIFPPPQQPPNSGGVMYESSAPEVKWLRARLEIPGIPDVQQFSIYKRSKPPQSYWEYKNCLDSAFETAVKALHERAAKWKAPATELSDWIRGQDRVFENCSGGPAIPSAVSGTADPLLVADREYQIASAQFYAGNFADAERRFRTIASSSSSPWREVARYMVARTLIRRASIDGEVNGWRDAEEKLNEIVKDPGAKEWQESAHELLQFIEASQHPAQRMNELEAALMKPNAGAQIARQLYDYDFLWGKVGRAPEGAGDLSTWIQVFQNGPAERAVAEWRERGTLPWLVASLAWANPGDAAAPDLIAAARRVKSASPAYVSATYYGIRLQADNNAEAARVWATSALQAKLSPAAHNMLSAERLKLARDWNEFLRFATRTPVAESSYDVDEPLAQGEQKPLFDVDATMPLNHRTPLAFWTDAAGNELLPRNLRADIAQAGWVRAMLLNNQDEAKRLAGHLAVLRPVFAQALRTWESERDADAAGFAAVFVMLRSPGLSPDVRSGFGRMTKDPGKIDPYRDNWWRLKTDEKPPEAPPDASREPLADLYPAGDYGPKSFLRPDQLAAGERETSELMKNAAVAANYLSAEAIRWAKGHPDDARVPEALHLAVRSTRYGNTDANTGKLSKEAFDLLHARYPRSKWAQMTKYWFE